MPIYAYKCSDCGHQQEVLQKFTDAPLTDCPSCGRSTMVKQVTAAGFQLKGTGWYATDFRNKTPAAKPDKQDGATESAKESAAKETATDSKVDAAPSKAGSTKDAAVSPAPAAPAPAPGPAPTGAAGGTATGS